MTDYDDSMFDETGEPTARALGVTLAEAREQLARRLDEGDACPCCDQFAKVYERRLTAPTGRVLIAMGHARHNAIDGWIDVPALAASMTNRSSRSTGGDEAKARYWGLIEAMPNVARDDGSTRTGWWRLTPLGVAFIENRACVAKVARIYNGQLLSLDDSEQVSIVDVLGAKFHYGELMGHTEAVSA
jgi:hypothetical protein